MKKIYCIVLGLIGLFVAQSSKAQCIPDPNLNYNGISPDGLPAAMAGYPYSTVLSFKIPSDSVVRVSGFDVPVTVDSAKFLYAAGKPAGFNFACDKPSCVWLGGTKGCALFSGMVPKENNDSTLEYPMKIYTMTWYHITGTPDPASRIDSATNYVFRILKYNGIGELTTYTKLTAYPNPTQGKVTIELRDIQDRANEVTVMDAFGKLVYSHSFDKPSSFLTTYTADLTGYTPGLYLVTLKSGNKISTAKVMLH